MKENQQNAPFLLGFVAVVLACLVGLSYWYVSSVPTDEVVEVPNHPSESQPSDRGSEARKTSDSKPVALFTQFDRKPNGYVGTAECAQCHADRHQSYLLTHHSRSLHEVDSDQENHGQTLVHRLSKRSYDVIAKDGGLWHRQWRHFSQTPNDRIPAGEFPVCFVIGSGAFAKGYLLADGEYLLQSPVTWYAGIDDLGMAPGYDRENHGGFTRVIDAECMFCHAGLLTQRDSNSKRLAIHELSIGCERCHGPGEAHAELYRDIRSRDLSTQDIDPKIVHPGKLDRLQTESICGQCHLHGDVVVHPPGRQIWDFIPGEDLAETRLHYKHDQPGEFADSFTGHFDQLWQSKCYLQSDTLTCVTCHDSHLDEPVTDFVEWRRQQCNGCHADDHQCGLPLDQRIQQADNSCTQCHMPSIQSNVPHTSTTSHWIAVYESGKPRGIKTKSTATIRRVQSSPAIPDAALNRADTVAKANWAVDQTREGDFESLDSVGLDDALYEVLRRAPEDSYVQSLLARINRLRADRMMQSENSIVLDKTWRKVARHATIALQLEKRPVTSREGALEALGNQQLRDGKYSGAASSFAELTQIRRSAVDWYNLGICFGKLQRLPEAERAFHEAIRIDGTYVAPYRSLSILYRATNPAASQQYSAVAQRLMLQ